MLKEKSKLAFDSVKDKLQHAYGLAKEKSERLLEFIRPYAKIAVVYCKAAFITAKRYFAASGYRMALGSGAASLVLVLAITIFVASGGGDKAREAHADDAVASAVEEEIPLSEPDEKEVHVIIADGKEIVALASAEEAEAVLTGITDRYKTRGSEIISLGFKETISIEKKVTEDNPTIFSVEDAVSYVITGTTEPRTYIIKGGDTFWDVAIAHGLSPFALQDMNPEFDPKKLKIGQEIYLYETFPFITVSFTEIVTAEERIAYQVVYEDNDGMYRGQTQVKSTGSYGSKEIKSEITKENGVVVSSVILSENITADPITQVAYRGTLPTPVYTGTSTGELSSPVASMNVISNYGSRGGRQHHGVDLKGPIGTPIYAAADGVVTFSGTSGSYGKLVKISHGNGIETRYSHNDSNIVSVGETVTKGQQIATMGATGNATTSHLHFEVRVNGGSKNPMNYI